MQLKLDLESEGNVVVGPFGKLSEALRAAHEDNFDIALIDINLGADNSAPIAEILDRRVDTFRLYHRLQRFDLPAAARCANIRV